MNRKKVSNLTTNFVKSPKQDSYFLKKKCDMFCKYNLIKLVKSDRVKEQRIIEIAYLHSCHSMRVLNLLNTEDLKDLFVEIKGENLEARVEDEG